METLKENSGRNETKTQAARALRLASFFLSFYTMVKLYNGGVFLDVLACAD